MIAASAVGTHSDALGLSVFMFIRGKMLDCLPFGRDGTGRAALPHTTGLSDGGVFAASSAFRRASSAGCSSSISSSDIRPVSQPRFIG